MSSYPDPRLLLASKLCPHFTRADEAQRGATGTSARTPEGAFPQALSQQASGACSAVSASGSSGSSARPTQGAVASARYCRVMTLAVSCSPRVLLVTGICIYQNGGSMYLRSFYCEKHH